MLEMQTIVTDACSVYLSRGSTRLCCAKTAEQIKILFRVNTLGGPRNILLISHGTGRAFSAAFGKSIWLVVLKHYIGGVMAQSVRHQICDQ